MSFPRYERYKDSGVEWLGAVPAHWGVAPFKWQVERNDGGVWGGDPDGQDDTIVLRSTEQTVDGRWRMDAPATRKLTSGDKQASLLAEGDLVVTKSSGSSLHIGKTTLVTSEIAALGCCYSNFMQRIRLKPSFVSRLAWYVLNNNLARLQFDLLSNSTTGLANLNGTMIGQIVLPVPPTSEQAAIAIFLDHETAKIDALVEEQKRLIELLKEKRQAAISHAVTKGLNSNAPMKDSGVEWLREMPAHWSVFKLKHITSQVTVGIVVEPSKYYVDEGVPALRSLNVRQEGVDIDGMICISEQGHSLHQKSRLRSGDLVAVRSGQPGTTAVIPDELDGCNCIDLIVIRKPSHGSERFLCWFMNSDAARIQYAHGSGGAIQQHFNVEAASNLVVAWPPSKEQERIAAGIAAAVDELERLVQHASAGVALLQERRTALISAAVTGKIDCRRAINQEVSEAA